MRNIRHRPVPADAGMRLRLRVLDAQVRNEEGHVDQAHAELGRLLVLRVGAEQGRDRRGRAAMQPGDRLACAVEPGLEVLDRDGVVVAVLHVILARPGQFHRRAFHGPRDERRLDDVVGLGLAPESAAEQRDVHRHAVDRKPKALRDAIARGLGRLRRRPHLAAVADDARRGGGRLHRRLRHVRDVVLGLQPPRRPRHAGRYVAEVANDLAGTARGLFQRSPVSSRIVSGVRTVVPGDLQGLTALDRGPGVARDDSNPAERLELRRRRRARDLDDLNDAGYFHRGGCVVGDELSAIDRWAGDDGVQHAVEDGVDAVLAAAGDDIRAVHQLHLALADVAELRGLFQAQRLARRHRQAGSCDGERSVAESALRRPVHDLMVERLHFGDGNPPARGRGLLQHGPRGGAAAAHRLEEMAHAARAVGVLVAEARFVARAPGARARAASRPRARRRPPSAGWCARPVPSPGGGR